MTWAGPASAREGHSTHASLIPPLCLNDADRSCDLAVNTLSSFTGLFSSVIVVFTIPHIQICIRSFNPTRCVIDVDECARFGVPACPTTQTCINTIGSFRCIPLNGQTVGANGIVRGEWLFAVTAFRCYSQALIVPKHFQPGGLTAISSGNFIFSTSKSDLFLYILV